MGNIDVKIFPFFKKRNSERVRGEICTFFEIKIKIYANIPLTKSHT